MKANNVVTKPVVFVKDQTDRSCPSTERASQLSRSFLLLGQHHHAQTTFTDSEKHPGANLILHRLHTRIYNASTRSLLHPHDTTRNFIRSTFYTRKVLQQQTQNLHTHQTPMPALFARDTNTPTMSGANPFQSANNAVAAGQENQTTEAQQHKQVLEKKAAADKKYVQDHRCRKAPWDTKEHPAQLRWNV